MHWGKLCLISIKLEWRILSDFVGKREFPVYLLVSVPDFFLHFNIRREKLHLNFLLLFNLLSSFESNYKKCIFWQYLNFLIHLVIMVTQSKNSVSRIKKKFRHFCIQFSKNLLILICYIRKLIENILQVWWIFLSFHFFLFSLKNHWIHSLFRIIRGEIKFTVVLVMTFINTQIY